MSPGGHLVTTAIACAAVQAATGSAALTAGIAAGGFLIDLDHVFDYVAFERQRDLRPAAFLRYYLAGRTRTAVLLLHSYEVLALLALGAWATDLAWLWGYVLGAAALHLPLDIVFNGKVAGRNMVPFYSFFYRWRAGFETARLLGMCRLAAPPSRFWSAFFIGAVAKPKPVLTPLEQVPPASLRPASPFRSAPSALLLASPSAAARPASFRSAASLLLLASPRSARSF